MECDSVNQQKQQRINRALIINLLRQQGLCSRAELAKLSGLQRATITNIIGEFVDCGLVVEDGLLGGDKGRRAIGVRVNGQRFRVLGVMVTRTHYSVSVMGLSGEIYEVRTFPIVENASVEQTIHGLRRDLNTLIAELPDAKVLAIGVAMPGPYKEENGEIIFVTNLVGWDGIPLYTMLQREFDIPVVIENDANAGACAQLWFGGKKASLSDMAYIVAGQGIGCGILSGGKLLKGSTGIAGEIGHTTIHYDGPQCECGNRGCLERYCSTLTLWDNLRERIKAGAATVLTQDFTPEEAAKAIREGDVLAREEYEKACAFLAVGIVNLINQLNPGTVIIGDALAELCPELMLEVISEKVHRSVRPLVWNGLSIQISDLPYNPILIGAGVIAAQKVFEDPFSYIKSGGEEGDPQGGR